MANTHDIVIPDLGDFDEVEVIEVLVSVGDSVAREDGLITLETDKATMDVPAADEGVIESLTVKVGDMISSGSVIGTMMVDVDKTVTVKPALTVPESPSATVTSSMEMEGSGPVTVKGLLVARRL